MRALVYGIEGDGEELWRIATLKKNGTFKKTAKPTVREAIKMNVVQIIIVFLIKTSYVLLVTMVTFLKQSPKKS